MPECQTTREPVTAEQAIEVGLRALWREMEPGKISAVEQRGAGGPLVSIVFDDGAEIHGVAIGEWETI